MAIKDNHIRFYYKDGSVYEEDLISVINDNDVLNHKGGHDVGWLNTKETHRDNNIVIDPYYYYYDTFSEKDEDLISHHDPIGVEVGNIDLSERYDRIDRVIMDCNECDTLTDIKIKRGVHELTGTWLHIDVLNLENTDIKEIHLTELECSMNIKLPSTIGKAVISHQVTIDNIDTILSKNKYNPLLIEVVDNENDFVPF